MGLAYMLNTLLPWRKEQKVKNLIFQGGSLKGIAYIGALEKLEENGIKLEKVQRIGGSSVGAITATLLSIGYDLNSLNKEIKQLNFKEFIDIKDETMSERTFNFLTNFPEFFEDIILELRDITDNFTRIRKTFMGEIAWNASKSLDLSTIERIKNSYSLGRVLLHAIKNDGLAEGDKVREWVEKKIFSATGITHATFAELNKKHQEDPKKFKQLYVTGVNIDTNSTEVFSHEDTPDMIISDAVRISMSIPVLFKPHRRYVKKRGSGRVLDENNRCSYVDGGLLDNYPMFIFDRKYPAKQTLGFRLETISDIIERRKGSFKDYKIKAKSDADPKETFNDYALAKVVLTALSKENSDFKRNNEYYNQRTIFINGCDISMINFELDDKQKISLIEAGYNGSTNYLSISGPKQEYYCNKPQTCAYCLIAVMGLVFKCFVATSSS